MSIIFSKLAGTNDPYIGKFEHPIKALIENESNILEKKKESLLARNGIEMLQFGSFRFCRQRLECGMNFQESIRHLFWQKRGSWYLRGCLKRC